MIHYHGLPITPETAAVAAVMAGHAFVSFRSPSQLPMAMAVCQSFAVDNGAFSAWISGSPITDWSGYYNWVSGIMRHPRFDFAVIPDVIDGSESENDALLNEWPHGSVLGAPVWHMHESLDRLSRLAGEYYRVCIGSSGEYAAIGTQGWLGRMYAAMDAVCIDGYPVCKLHGLRMLNPAIFQKYPLSSADSTNIGRNVGIDKSWGGSYQPATKEARATVMRGRIESVNSACKWVGEEVFNLVAGKGQ